MTKPREKTRKIALFLPGLNSGGAEKSFVTLANYWAEQEGYDVDFLVRIRIGQFVDILKTPLIELGPNKFKTFLPLVRYLNVQKPDALIAGLPGPNLMACLARIFCRHKFRLIISQHHPFSLNAGNLKGFKQSLRILLAKILYRQADKIVCVSKGVADDLARTLGISARQLVIIHNPVDRRPIEEAGKEALSLPEFRGKTIVSAGRLAPPKDFETLIQAMKELENVRCIILGEGQKHKELQELSTQLGLEQRIMFTGFVQNPYAYIVRADALVLSSKHEGFGNVLIEAMALGKPVISSDCESGPREIINSPALGELCIPGDSQDMARAIRKVLAGAYDSATLKQRAADFALESIAAQYEDLL